MKKLFYYHFDVGSAIEFSGDIFGQWIKESGEEYEIYTHKDQSQGYETFPLLQEQKPDVIILNENYAKAVEPIMYYKLINPDVKVVFIAHVWRDLEYAYSFRSDFRKPSNILDWIKFHKFIEDTADEIFCLNYKPDGKFHPNIQDKTHNHSYPTDPEFFGNFIPWNNRAGNFLIAGNLLEHKIHPEFLDALRGSDIKIDVYGYSEYDDPKKKEYVEKILAHPNFNYCGLYPQDKMPELFNLYKYFILPHNGYEPFNWTLLQAISCGTIPLVSNDRKTNQFDKTWIDWAEDLYFGCNTPNGLAANLEVLSSQPRDMSDISLNISAKAQSRFNYSEMKEAFLKALF